MTRRRDEKSNGVSRPFPVWTHLVMAAALALSGALTGASPASSQNGNRPRPQVVCDGRLLAGSWVNNGKEYKGVGVALSVQAASGWAEGSFTSRVKPNGVWPVPMLRSISVDGAMKAPVEPPRGQCLFKASCQDTSGPPSVCWVQFDVAAGAFRVSSTLGPNGIVSPRESAPWSRPSAPATAAAAAPPATCGGRDVDGVWHRTDGSAVKIEGGNADYVYYPRGWPRGVSRYTGVRQEAAGACTFRAACVEIQGRSGETADFSRTEAACTLTLDPAKGVLSQGGKVAWSRTPAQTPEAQALRRGQAELMMQDALSEGLNAEVNERNAEAEARDRAREAEYQRKQREYEARKKADAEAYARAQAEYERKKAEAEARRKADLAAWERAVAACKAGDRTQCAQQ